MPALPNKPDDQWRLALWCDQNGLKEQTTVHLRRVITLDPKREAAWRRLGFKKQGSQWVKPELAAAEKTEFEAQHHANRTWSLKLERRANAGRAREGEASSGRRSTLADHRPAAVPMVWMVFVRGDLA